MKTLWQKFTAALPMPFSAALLVAAAFWAFVTWDQSHWWSTKEDYGFGWLVPAFVGFVIHDRWLRITTAAAACVHPEGPGRAGWRRFCSTRRFMGRCSPAQVYF